MTDLALSNLAGASRRAPPIDLVVTETPLKFRLKVVSRMIGGGFFAFCAVTYLKNAFSSLEEMDLAHLTLGQAANIMSILSITFFMGLVAYLYAVQLPPLTKFAGWLPAVAACVGSFAMVGLVLLDPRHDLSTGVRLLSASLIDSGNVLAI
jgi:hypothetical protein